MGWVFWIGIPAVGLAGSIWRGERGPFYKSLHSAGVAVSGVVLAVVLIMAAFVALETKNCAEKGEKVGMTSEFSVWTDCMVDTPTGWFPYDQLRDIDR